MKMVAKVSASLVLASLALTPAMARDWNYVTGTSRDVIIAVAPASIMRAGGQVSGLFRFRDRSGDTYKHIAIDCRRASIGEADAAAAIVRAPRDIALRPVVNGSVGASLASNICGNDNRPDPGQAAGPVTYMPPPAFFATARAN